jgi:hypothetical protein
MTSPPNLRFSAPAEYDRMLRRAHELTLAGVPQSDIAPAVQASWRRSLAAGVDPDGHRPRHLHEMRDVVELRREHPLDGVIPALSELLADVGSDGRHLLVIADAAGEVLWRVGSRSVLRLADGLEFVEGADWSESGIGTNAISEVVSSGQAAQFFSAEHLVRTHHEWACTAAPIRHPVTGVLLGVINVSGPLETITADSVRMVKGGVRLAEEMLRTRPELRMAAGRGQGGRGPASVGVPVVAGVPVLAEVPSAPVGFGRLNQMIRLLGDAPGIVRPDGSLVPLSLRRAEIVALLASRTRGWTAEELAYELHGELGSAGAIRIEMHRLRALLGDMVLSHPYRLSEGIRDTADAGHVLRLLHAGALAEALDLFAEPLLCRSTAPAIESLRRELTDAVGAAVRASGSAPLLSRWCATEMGAADQVAADELERLLGPGNAGVLAFRARARRHDREFGA